MRIPRFLSHWRDGKCLVTAQMALQGMIDTAANYDFAPVDQTANAIFVRKTVWRVQPS